MWDFNRFKKSVVFVKKNKKETGIIIFCGRLRLKNTKENGML